MLSGNLVSLLSPFFITVPISFMAPQVYIEVSHSQFLYMPPINYNDYVFIRTVGLRLRINQSH